MPQRTLALVDSIHLLQRKRARSWSRPQPRLICRAGMARPVDFSKEPGNLRPPLPVNPLRLQLKGFAVDESETECRTALTIDHRSHFRTTATNKVPRGQAAFRSQ